jgi:RimJ/RimL family protein N-acetyltransferase
MAAACGDAQIRRYNGPRDEHGQPDPPPTIAVAERTIQRFASSRRAFIATGDPTGVAFAITDAASGQLMGCCGVDSWIGNADAQFGYWLAPSARGHGYATRSVILVASWLFALGATRVFLTIEADNVDSAAVARRAGLEHEDTRRGQGIWLGRRIDVLVFAARAAEWRVPSADAPALAENGIDRRGRGNTTA